MFSQEDIQNAGNITLSEKTSMELASGDMEGQWESLVNLRLNKDGKYPYWKLRGGLAQEADIGATILATYSFQATLGATKKKYIAVHTDAGNVKVYDTSAGSVAHTLSGFSQTEQVQFHSSGSFLYVFDGGNSKYINLETGVISDYLANDSTPIKSYQSQTTQGLGNLFSVSDGDRALVFPPDISDLDRNAIFYDVYNSNGVYNEEDSTSVINGRSWATGFKFKTTLEAGSLYAIDKSSMSDVDSLFTDSLTYEHTDSNGFFYFRPDKPTDVVFEATSDTPQIPVIEIIVPDYPTLYGDFTNIMYATIRDVDGTLHAFFDNGSNLSFDDNYIEQGGVDTSQNLWTIAKVDESIASLAGESVYNKRDTIVPDDGDSSEDIGITYYHYSGTLSFSTTDIYYRKYVCIDVLDDGSICMPGLPKVVERDPLNDTIGVSLEVDPPATNVYKRYLCATRYENSIDRVCNPSSTEYPNGPLFIVGEVDTEKTTIYDFSINDFLTRPLTELLPIAGGVPAIFGSGQLNPNTVCSFNGTVAIGGYEVARPVPAIHTNASSDGNVYFDKAGADTARTVTVYFGYTDGTYSTKATATLGDTSNKLVFHGLNSLISNIYVYVNDGSNDYKIGSFRQNDPEFGGKPLTIPTDLSPFEQTAIPSGLEEQTSVMLDGYVTIPVPIQNIQIASQAKVFGNRSIVGIVPLDYDQDKTELRYRLRVFTDKNIQTGFIREVTQDTIVRYQSNFEVALSSRRATSRSGICRVGGAVFYQDERGISVLNGSNSQLIINSKEYPTASSNLTSAVFNEQDGEIWFLFGGTDVIVFDVDTSTIREFSFTGGNITASCYHDNKIFLSAGTKLCQGESGGTDLGNTITGKAISTYFGDNRSYTELHELHLFGKGASVQVDVDDQPQREPYAQTVDGFDFTAQKSVGPKDVKPNGTIYPIRKRGIKMRIGLTIENASSMIEDIIMKYSATDNPM